MNRVRRMFRSVARFVWPSAEPAASGDANGEDEREALAPEGREADGSSQQRVASSSAKEANVNEVKIRASVIQAPESRKAGDLDITRVQVAGKVELPGGV